MCWNKARNNIKIRPKGSIQELGMPFKSEPGLVAVYKERKYIHMFYVKWEGFLSHIGSVVFRGLSLLNHYVGLLSHMLHPLCLRIWNGDPSEAGVFKHLGRGWNWMKTKTEMHKRQSCLWQSFQVKAGNQKKANGTSSGGNTGKKISQSCWMKYLPDTF